MTEPQRCSSCGLPLDPPGLAGLCPACLIKLGLPGPGGAANVESDDENGPDSDFPPAFIGPYRILGMLGEGGMGVVYLAEQTAPLQRRVAVKVIKFGMDTREVVARFEAERQALALMEHPNIASVFDAGATEDGRPYFVMEYVPGMAITAYCDEQRLPTPARLELFTKVCGAIQHAHQKGVVHRDLKPSNVLVMVQDGEPVPKVIDFGVAKATHRRLTERTLFTEHGQLIGTPEYMSPEQAETTALDVDATTDIYSLGILLYELLVGHVPFESARLRQAGYAEIRRIIREEEPVKPSTKLTSLGAKASDVAGRHQTSVRMLERELTGDLDWITLRALEKDRTRRYPSASELAADIARHLADEPVVARPPSMPYRLRKFARRRRGAVVATGLVAAALVAGLVVSMSLFFRAEAAFQEADRQRVKAQRGIYVANLGLAAANIDELDTKAAQSYLARTEPELRGWEWRHLQLRADPSLATLWAYGPFTHFPGLTSSFFFSEDGRKMFWNTEGTVHVWDTSQYRQVAAYGGFGGSVLALAPGARLVVVKAATDNDFTLRLIEPISRRTVATLSGLDSDASCATFSADGTRVAAGSDSGGIQVWDTNSGHVLASLAERQWVEQLRFSPDGQRLALASSGSVKIWQPGSGRTSRVLQEEGATAIAFSPDGTHFAASAADQTIRIWDLRRGGEPRALKGHSGWILAVAFSPDGTKLASASDDKSVRIWNLQAQVATAILPASFEYVSSLAFDPTGQHLFTGEHFADRAVIKMWDALSQGGLSTIAETAAVKAFSPDGRLLLVSNPDGSVSTWNVEAQRVEATVRDGEGPISSPVFDPSGGRFAGTIGKTGKIWDLATGRTVTVMAGHTEDLSSIAFSPAGTEVITTSRDKSARVWDASSGRMLATLEVAEQTNAAAFTPDGAAAIVGSGDPSTGDAHPNSPRLTVHRWDWRAGQVTASIDGRDNGAVTSVAISPDGRRVALAGSGVTMAHIWDDRLEKRIGVTAQQSLGVFRVAFSPDSQRLITVSWDGSVRVWDADTADQLLVMHHGNRQEIGLAISPDSSRIATSDGTRIYLWESRAQQELAASALVESLSKDLVLSADVVSHLERDRTLPSDVREAALRLAWRLTDNPDAINDTAWEMVTRPGSDAAAYRRALRFAEAARRAAPWTATYVTTIGLAHYRLGDYQTSITALESDGTYPAIQSTILAMAYFRIGKVDQAKALLNKARTALGTRTAPTDLQALMTEAERMLAGK